MDMTVDNAGHDEFSAEIRDLSLKIRKTVFIAYIDEFTVLHCKSGCLRIGAVSSEDFCIFNNLICLHICSFPLPH